MDDSTVDALFVEMVWNYYAELTDELIDYTVRSMERLQHNLGFEP